MNTSTAAATAGVTVATIRTWCRRNVIGAVKAGGRWVIDTASLAHRIALGNYRRTRKQAAMLDLNATYTISLPGKGLTTITPAVKRRTTPHAGNIIRITGIVPLLADRIDTITDPGNRAHAVTILEGARIVISDTYDANWDQEAGARDGGRLRTTYRGEIPQITVGYVLDLADQLRSQLAA